MENRAYGMDKGRFAFLYKLPPKLILLLNTAVWLMAGLLLGAAAESFLEIPINTAGMAALLSLTAGYCGGVIYLIRRK